MTSSIYPVRQRGAVLLVALIILLVLTLLAMTSMRGTTLENRLIGNQGEQQNTLNTGESALRAGERRLAQIAGEDDKRKISCEGLTDICVLTQSQIMTTAANNVRVWNWWSADSVSAWWANSANALSYNGSDGLTRFSPAPRWNTAYFASDLNSSLNVENNNTGVYTDYYFVTTYASANAGRMPLVLQSVSARRYTR